MLVIWSVGRADANVSRSLQFKSSHRQNLTMNIFALNCLKDENNEKKGGNCPFIKTDLTEVLSSQLLL